MDDLPVALPLLLFLCLPEKWKFSSATLSWLCHIPGEASSSTGMPQINDAPPLKPRHLLRGEITYSVAKEEDANILHELGYRDKKIKYFTHLYRNRKVIERTVAHHLGLTSADRCHLVDVEDWIDGSFNVCIRVDIDDRDRGSGKRLMIRFPLPYRIGENPHPGNADEKIRCEVGTYAWLQENCPNVPIPQLYGFGLSTGQTVCMHLTIFQRDSLLIVLVHPPRQSAFCNPCHSVSTPSSVKVARLPDSISIYSAPIRRSSYPKYGLYSD